MAEELKAPSDPESDKKRWQARSDKKRVGSLFQVRLDSEMTLELENFMIREGMNRSQALKHIIKEFFRSD